MNEYLILKEALKKIKCNFLSTQTLIGYTVIVQCNSEKEINYEFDLEGKFLRVI